MAEAFQQLEAFYNNRHQAWPEPNPVRWSTPAQWHLTWAFLGNVQESYLPEIQARLLESLSALSGATDLPSLQLDQLAIWPSPNRPQTLVWTGPTDQPPVQALARSIQSRLLSAEQAARPFRPHITLGRFKNPPKGRLLLPESFALAPTCWQIETLHLYQSHLEPTGARYEPLLSWPEPPGERL
jgi:2'-5' RNA ligase